VENSIKKTVKIHGFPEELDIDIESYRWDHVLFEDVVGNMFSNELIKYIINVKGQMYTEKKMKEHRLVNLLYRMRNKLAHELSSPGMDSFFDNDCNFEEPYYCDYGRTYREGNNLVTDDVIELRIPYIFIRNILEDCFQHYTDECIRTKRTPFSHNKMTRTHVLSWYDK